MVMAAISNVRLKATILVTTVSHTTLQLVHINVAMVCLIKVKNTPKFAMMATLMTLMVVITCVRLKQILASYALTKSTRSLSVAQYVETVREPKTSCAMMETRTIMMVALRHVRLSKIGNALVISVKNQNVRRKL